ELQGRRAGVFILVEDLLPRLAAVGRAEDAALGVGPVGVAQHGDEDAVGVLGIDEDRRDLLAVAQAQVFPRLAAVGRFVDAIADGQVGALEALAAADVEDVGVGRRYGQGADGAGGLVVEDGVPGAAGVGGLPDTAVVDADVEDVGLAGDADGADGAPAAEGADHAPAQGVVMLGGDVLGV